MLIKTTERALLIHSPNTRYRLRRFKYNFVDLLTS